MAERAQQQAARLSKLLGYLEADPRNTALLSDAAETALNAQKPDTARELLSRLQALQSLAPAQMNLLGLASMQSLDFAGAAAQFEALLKDAPQDTSLRFNLAWSRAMLKDFAGALELLDQATVEALPQAAMLEVQLLHQVERFDEAAAAARKSIARHRDHAGLLGVTSTLAMDIEDIPLARACAERAGDHPDALTTLGMLALGEDRNAEAHALFERALIAHSSSARAFVGKGLSELVAGRSAEAAGNIVKGANIFGDHVGSWIAAGWAHLLNNDRAEARAAFEKALRIDQNFSESHGSLAVLDVLEGNIESAKRAATLAIRLDPQSFSGALAQAIILSEAGQPQRAQALIERALHTPIDASGRTIAQSLARYAF